MKYMNKRKLVKEQHENSIIYSFMNYLNELSGALGDDKHFKLISRPEPPDAIISNGKILLWLELADIFRNPQEAHAQYSSITPGEEKFSMDGVLIIEPDQQIENALFQILQKKLNHGSYKKITEIYGKGILILNERDPLFSNNTYTKIKELVEDLKTDGYLDSDYFYSIYLSTKSIDGLIFTKLAELNSIQSYPFL